MTEFLRSRTGLIILFVVIALLAALSGFYLYHSVATSSPDEMAVRELRRLALPDSAGRPHSLSQWTGTAVVVNFWATWCAPCREEMPILSKINQEYAGKGLQIVGIAVDSAANVRKFEDETKIGYPLVVGGIDIIDLARKLGNKAGALPYTVVLDLDGRIAGQHLGAISEAQLLRLVQNALPAVKTAAATGAN
jgi:thiol-disulfide isomerase/thioredoxin